MAGKISTVVAQTVPASDWLDKLTGPLGALVAMGIGIWWLSARNTKQDAKIEAQQKVQDEKDAEHLESRIQSRKIMTEALESTKAVVAHCAVILEKSAKALENHDCVSKK